MPALRSRFVAECHGLRCYEQRLCLLNPNGKTCFDIRRAEVRRLKAGYGTPSRRRIRRLVASITMISVGVLTALLMVDVIRFGMKPGSWALGVLMIPVGAGIAIKLFKRRFWLEAKTSTGRYRLAFRPECSAREAKVFISSVERAFQVSVDRRNKRLR